MEVEKNRETRTAIEEPNEKTLCLLHTFPSKMNLAMAKYTLPQSCIRSAAATWPMASE